MMALAGIAAAAAVAFSGCTTINGLVYSEEEVGVHNTYDKLSKQCIGFKDMSACNEYMKYRDLFNQCLTFKKDNPRACGQLGKSFAYGDGLIPRDLKTAGYLLRTACGKSDSESCQLYTGALPEDKDSVMPGREESTEEGRAREVLDLTTPNWVVWTCPTAPDDIWLRTADYMKRYVRENHPILREGYPEYWQDGIGPARGRNLAWYLVPRREVHPGRK